MAEVLEAKKPRKTRKKKSDSSIILPRQDKDGNYYISYSQHNTFTGEKGFSTGLLGKLEYIQGYFFGVNYPDQGWGEFGGDVEDYVCYKGLSQKERDKMDKVRIKKGERTLKDIFASFTEDEKKVLDTVEPIGVFQKEIKIWLFDNVYIKGFMDDCNEDMSYLRDYKTCSASSGKKYYGEDYEQLDIYSLYALQETGKIPEKLEVCMIERKGNCFGMERRRDLLSVGSNVWYHERETSKERLDAIKEKLRDSVREISELYKVFLATNI